MQICYGFVMGETSWCLLLTITRLWILRRTNLRQDTHIYLDDLLNIDNPCFEKMGSQIYPTELLLNKQIIFDTEAPFVILDMSINIYIASAKRAGYFAPPPPPPMRSKI